NGIAVSTPLAVGQVLIVPAPPASDGRSAAAAQTASPPPPTAPGAAPDPDGMPSELWAAFTAMGARSGSGDARGSPEPTPSPAATCGAPRGAAARGRVEATVRGSLPPPAAAHAAPPQRISARSGSLQWPLRGVLYARFGRKGKNPHDGIDLSAPAGTPVKTAG